MESRNTGILNTENSIKIIEEQHNLTTHSYEHDQVMRNFVYVDCFILF